MNTKFYISVINTFLVIFISSALMAQVSADPMIITVVEGNYELSGILRNGFEAEIEGDSKEIIKRLKSEFKETYSIKMSKRGNSLSTTNQMSTLLSDKHFDIHAELIESPENKRLRVWMNFGTDVYVTSDTYAPEATKLNDFIRSFIIDYYNGYLNELIIEKERMVKKLDKSLAKETKSKLKLEKTEGKYTSKLEDSKNDQLAIQEKIASLNEELASEKLKEKEYVLEIEKSQAELKQEAETLSELASKRTAEDAALKRLRQRINALNALK